MAADEDEGVRSPAPRGLGEVDDLGHVGQVVQGEADRPRLPLRELAQVLGVVEDLQVEQAHVVTGGADGGRHALEPERLEAQVQLGVEQRARMHEQNAHWGRPSWGGARQSHRKTARGKRPCGALGRAGPGWGLSW